MYRPYRPKRRTRATIAKEKGLEPLAQTILAQESSVDIMAEAAKYVDAEKDVADEAAALAGAKDIIAENVSDNADYRTKKVQKRQPPPDIALGHRHHQPQVGFALI